MALLRKAASWARARQGLLAWASVLVVGAVLGARTVPMLGGDGLEYQATVQAFFAHGTPDIRSDDLAGLSGSLRADRSAPGRLAQQVYPIGSDRGPAFAQHFWLYALTQVPARAVLHVLRGDELAAAQVTNFVLLWLAVGFALRVGPGSRRERAWFVALCLVSPVLWYLPWPSPEVFTWSLVVVSLVAWRARRLGLAAFAAAVASLQNPAAVALAALAVGRALWRRDARATLAATAGSAVAALAPAFNVYFFGEPSLIHKIGGADFDRLGLARTWSFLVDLNQGMLPYVPGLLALALVGLVRVRRAPGIVCALAALAMIVVCGVPPNWNCGETGIQRYAVWIIPVVACVVMLEPPPLRWRGRVLGAVVALHGLIVLLGSTETSYTTHNALATFVLDNAPSLYDPDPEIFAERTLHYDGYRGELPVVYATEDGEVTKVLTDARSLRTLFSRYGVSDSYCKRVTEDHGRDEGLFYLEPPRGALRQDPAARSGAAR